MPVEGTRVTDGWWVHDGLAVRLPAPPTTLSPDSGDDVVAYAREAVALGLASCVPLRPGLRQVFTPPAPLPWSRARALPPGVGRATATTFAVVLASFGGWLVLATALLLVGEITQRPAVSLVAVLGVLVVLSAAGHEGGHVLAHRLLSGPAAPAVLVSRRQSCYLVRPALSTGRDVLVTLAGPVVPLAIALPALGLIHLWPLPVLAQLAIGLAHLACLLWPAGDGLALRHALQERQSSRRPRPGVSGRRVSFGRPHRRRRR